MKKQAFHLAVALLAAMSFASCADEEETRNEAIPRSVELGRTLSFSPGYISSDPYVGDMATADDGNPVFVPRRLGSCEVYNPALGQGRYLVTVTGGMDLFPGLVLDFGATYAEVTAAMRYPLEPFTNPLRVPASEVNPAVYTYTFTDNERLSGVEVTFSRYQLADNDKTGLDRALEYLDQRYAPADADRTLWYDAFSPENATMSVAVATTDTKVSLHFQPE